MIWVPLERYNPEEHAVQTNVATSSQFIAEGNSDPYSRPGYGGNWFVRDPIHGWLVERQIDYKLISTIATNYGTLDSKMQMMQQYSN
jgi:hypothetical protein